MLELRNVRKSYTTGEFTQVALDDVSIAFRASEFVAVLGPSGSGKTTMLNIVGGLDQYDDGDLIIDGISTKQYRDRDWDSYRNRRVGFVFQSYNLISHQSVLANVELALTLAGVSRAERRRRAFEALDAVGLADHIHKRPNQLSGGQMQRVAIARALVNDPEILLADEPTGALDTTTSEQIMTLLTHIARDRLVVMVTHNPELAEEHATRVVRLTDGQIIEDTDPYTPPSEPLKDEQNRPRVGMGFLTAIALSFNNLMTKKGRTLMTSFAGSIGIIGIAAILALANGVNAYIKNVERETLSQYPLLIQQQSFDMASLMGASQKLRDEQEGANTGEQSVREVPLLKSMFSSVGTNDLGSLKRFLDSPDSGIDPHVRGIEYSYDITPLIFAPELSDGPRKVNPDPAMSALGLAPNEFNQSMSMGMRSSAFAELVGDLDLVRAQYDVVAGQWPEHSDELVVVLSSGGGLSDLALYSLGLLDPDELQDMLQRLRKRETIEVDTRPRTFAYSDVVGKQFRLVHASDLYTYDSGFDVWADRSDDDAYVSELVRKGMPLKVVGVVRPDGADAGPLSPGIYWTRGLTEQLMAEAARAPIVKEQLAHPETNVITGRKFSDDEPRGELDMSQLFSIDKDAMAGAFRFDQSKLQPDFSGLDLDIDPSGFRIDRSSLPPLDLSGVMDAIDPASLLPDAAELSKTLDQAPPALPEVDTAALAQQLPALADAYTTFARSIEADPSALQEVLPQFLASDDGRAAIAQTAVAAGQDPQDASKVVQEYQRFIESEQLDPNDVLANVQQFLARQQREAVQSALQQVVDSIDLTGVQGQVQQQLQDALADYMQQAMQSVMADVGAQLGEQIRTQLSGALEEGLGDLEANMKDAMSIDEEAFQKAFKLKKTPEELSQLLMSLASTQPATYDSNLRALGYASIDEPDMVSIYPKDFESKAEVTAILERYNQEMRSSGQESKAITYSDFVGALMSSVTDIINTISTVLIAFVAISLVVSSIMIGVITAISVLERTKEIGILRAMGASRRDIRRVFNAETLIVGLAAGLLGVAVTWLLTIPTNMIVLERFDVPNVAVLPLSAAVILVLVSMVLTSVAGLMPATSASRKDPVRALRSE